MAHQRGQEDNKTILVGLQDGRLGRTTRASIIVRQTGALVVVENINPVPFVKYFLISLRKVIKSNTDRGSRQTDNGQAKTMKRVCDTHKSPLTTEKQYSPLLFHFFFLVLSLLLIDTTLIDLTK